MRAQRRPDRCGYAQRTLTCYSALWLPVSADSAALPAGSTTLPANSRPPSAVVACPTPAAPESAGVSTADPSWCASGAGSPRPASELPVGRSWRSSAARSFPTPKRHVVALACA